MAPHSDHESDTSMRSDIREMDIPILIVGGGPAGLVLAHMLSQLGVKSLIIERYHARLAAPKAHVISGRTMEMCRQFDLDMNELRSLGTKREDAYWVNFVSSLQGQWVASFPFERYDAEVLEHTPAMVHNIPQPIFEDFVAARLARDAKVEIRKGHSFMSCKQSGDRVITTIEDRDTNQIYEICSRHVAACDGAKSRVRQTLGVECEGELTPDTMMTIHFNANLRPLMGKNPGMLHWIMDPEVSGFIIGYDLDGNQVLICNFDAEKHPVESWTEDHARKVVTTAIGPGIPFDVLSYRPWVMSLKVAKNYSIGNIFLVGDAAHSFPPTGGLGLNSGLGDVHNLAWKLAAVHQNWASPSLLETYHTDRRQVAFTNAKQSVKNGQKIFGLLKTLGTTDRDIATAKKNLYHRITDPKSRLSVMKGIEAQREHFNNIGLHIGYIYGDTEIPMTASLYVPSYRPGARLPHTWISKALSSSLPKLPPIDNSYVTELSATSLINKQFSTLDLCAFDAFTFIFSSEFESHWSYVLANLRAHLFKLPVHSILRVNKAVLGEDFNLIPGTRGKEWLMGMQLEHGAAVMVRPDQHILSCHMENAGVEEVAESLAIHLGHGVGP